MSEGTLESDVNTNLDWRVNNAPNVSKAQRPDLTPPLDRLLHCDQLFDLDTCEHLLINRTATLRMVQINNSPVAFAEIPIMLVKTASPWGQPSDAIDRCHLPQ